MSNSTGVRSAGLRGTLITVGVVVIVLVMVAVTLGPALGGSNGSETILILTCIVGFFFVLIFGLISAFNLRNTRRTRSLVRSGAGTFIVQVNASGSSVIQLKDVAQGLGLPRPRVWASSYVTLLANGDRLRLYGGGRNPKLLFDAPATAIRTLSVGSAEVDTRSGSRSTTGIRLTFMAGNAALEVDFVVFALNTLLPSPLNGDDLQAAADKLRSSLRPSGH